MKIKNERKNKILLILYLSEIIPPIKLNNIIGIALDAATMPKLIAESVSL